LKEKKKTGDRVFRIWSAACSTGEEPYSLAITLLEFLENHPRYEIQILGTDISTQVLNIAIRGIYEKSRITDISFDLFRKYFLRGENKWRRFYMVKPELSKIVCFKRVNLAYDPFSFSHPFDIIFCRNVMIYFDQKTQEKLIEKCHSILNPGRYLFIGHSESLVGIKHKFQYVQPTIYKK
jgi:chemotaxis protein methyltransferase CheR